MTETGSNNPLAEGAIDSFEEKLAGKDGAAFYRECLAQLTEAENKVRLQLSRGLPRAEAENMKTLGRALAQGRTLLDDVWSDMRG